MGAVAWAEPSIVVASTGKRHTPKVSAHSQHHKPVTACKCAFWIHFSK
jgi:hypothetical protein